MKAWYFTKKDKKLGYKDGRKVAIGRTHKIEGKPKLCDNGLHGSVRILDALFYARSPIVYRVNIKGNIDKGINKICGQERTYLYGSDISDILKEFMCWCALQVIYTWDAPQVVINWLKTRDEKYRLEAYDSSHFALSNTTDRKVYAAICSVIYSINSYTTDSILYTTRSIHSIVRAVCNAIPFMTYKKCNAKLTRMVNKKFKKA